MQAAAVTFKFNCAAAATLTWKERCEPKGWRCMTCHPRPSPGNRAEAARLELTPVRPKRVARPGLGARLAASRTG